MFASAFINTLQTIVRIIGDLYLSVVILRFLLQVVRADFYNPASQAIVQLTSPLLKPLRRVIPGWRNLDIASLVLALLVSAVEIAILALLSGAVVTVMPILVMGLLHLIDVTLNIYLYGVIISVAASWIAPFSGHPALLALYQLLQPLYRLARRILPDLGVIDLSPMLIMLGIYLIRQLLLAPLASVLMGLL